MNDLSTDERYWVWLASIDGVFAKWFYILQSVFFEPKAVWEHAGDIPSAIPNFPTRIAKAIADARDPKYLDRIFEDIEKCALHVTTAITQNYPYTLEVLTEPPPVLYYKGRLPDVWDRCVSIVGTRKPSRNGEKFVRKIACEIAAQDVTVVSGMARGIDTAAHEGTLDANGVTVAVLGCGADVVYPKENMTLYERIAERGTVLSEFRPGTPPIAENFPRRNRIIAALSGATVVSEGGRKSGARITADLALSLGRQVFAIPCEPGSDVSALPIFLLKSGASLLSESADLMDAMNWKMKQNIQKKVNNNIFRLDFFQEQLYNSLLKGTLTAEQLADRLDVPVSRVNSALTIMEVMGAVESLPGNGYGIK